MERLCVLSRVTQLLRWDWKSGSLVTAWSFVVKIKYLGYISVGFTAWC